MTDPRPFGAKHQHSRQAATIGDAPGSNDANRAHNIDNRWNERQRATVAGMPAGLGALRGDTSDSASKRFAAKCLWRCHQ